MPDDHETIRHAAITIAAAILVLADDLSRQIADDVGTDPITPDAAVSHAAALWQAVERAPR